MKACIVSHPLYLTASLPRGATVCTHLRQIQLISICTFLFFLFHSMKRNKNLVPCEVPFSHILCANSLISRTVLRRPFPLRTAHRFRKPDNAPSSCTGPLISEFLPRHFARHHLRIKVSANFERPPPNRLNIKTCVHTVAQRKRLPHHDKGLNKRLVGTPTSESEC